MHVRQNGDLRGWARQGVLLLNTCLTVPAGRCRRAMPGSAGSGWPKRCCDAVSARPAAFLLWGGHAQKLRPHIRAGDHLVLETAHPSPLSARRGFFGSRPFSRVNLWLARTRGRTGGLGPIARKWGFPTPTPPGGICEQKKAGGLFEGGARR